MLKAITTVACTELLPGEQHLQLQFAVTTVAIVVVVATVAAVDYAELNEYLIAVCFLKSTKYLTDQ